MMNERRPQPTTADYLLAGLSPALIIGMINCLVFFLIIVIYRGDFTVRLMYLLGLYTLGSVMVARIAIEQNRAVAFGYMLGLGAAGLFVIQRFVAFDGVLAAFSIPIVLGFLVLIAFLADRITFDCTLIDEQEDSSGEGLLQSLRLVESTMTPEDRAKMAQRTQNGRKVKHNPGVWVLYFALLAIPLFGLGQLVIPSYDAGSRDRAFWFLVGYLFFALALLVNTSFLGLRRYLRKRSVAMPATMATTWMASGIIGVVLLLAVACFLPLPGRNAGLISLPFTATSPTSLQASSYGWGGEGVSQQPDQDRSKNEAAAKVENGKASEDKSKSVRSGDKPETTSDQSKSKSKDPSSNKDESSSRNDSSKSKDSNGKNDPSQKQTSPTESKSSEKSQPDAKSSQNQKSPTDQADKRQSESSAKDRMKSNNQGQKESQESEKEQAGSKKDPGQKSSDPKDQQQLNQEQQKKDQEDRRQEDQQQEDQQQEDPQQQEREQQEREQQESDSQQKTEQQSPPQKDRQLSPKSQSNSTNSPQAPRSSSMPQAPQWLGSLPGLIKWLTALLLLGVIVVFLIMHGREWLAALQSMFGGSSRSSSDAEAKTTSLQAVKPLAAFSTFENPFLSGKGWQAVDIVRHTFEAMEAWGREHGMPRSEGETPEEYLSRLAFRFANVREELNRFSRVYNRLAYAAATVQTRDVQPLSNLWQWMKTQS